MTSYHWLKIVIVLFLCGHSVSSVCQIKPIPIDTEGEVLAVHQASNGLIYYIQEGKDPIYRNRKIHGWLKVYNGYKSINLHRIRLNAKITNEVYLRELKNNELTISTYYESFIYNLGSNEFYQLNPYLIDGISRSRIDGENTVYSIGSGLENTASIYTIKDNIHKEIICPASSYRFHLYGNKILTFLYDNEGPYSHRKFSGWVINDMDGNVLKSYSKNEIKAMFPSLNISSISLEKEIIDKHGLKLKLKNSEWIEWDGNFGFKIIGPKIDLTDDQGKKAEINQNEDYSTVYIQDSGNQLIRSDTLVEIGRVNDIYSKDFLKSYWIGCKKGLFKVVGEDRRIKKVMLDRSLRAIHPYDEDYLLVGTEVSKFYKVPRRTILDNSEILPTERKSLQNSFITQIAGKHYVSSHYGLYEIEDGKIYTPIITKSQRPVMCMIDKQKVAISYFANELFMYDTNTGNTKIFDVLDTSTRVISMLSLPNQRVVLATFEGLYIYDIAKNKLVFSDSTLLNTLSLYKYDDQSFYLGSEDGSIREFDLHNNTYQILNTWQAHKPIATINSTNGTELWLGTFDGISKLNLQTGSLLSIEKDKISDSECNRYSSYYDSTYKKMYIGTIEGLNIIDVESDIFESKNFELFFLQNTINKDDTLQTNLIVNKKEIDLTLPSKNRGCRLTFTTSDILDDDIKEYRYRINNDPWSAFTRSNELNISYFKTGMNYLEIQAKSSKGQISSNVLKANIYATPMFYEAWWFRLALLSIFLVGIYLWFRRISNENKRLEKVVEKRTSQIREERIKVQQQANDLKKLDALKNQFFANISHELRTPLTLLISPLEKLESGDNLSDAQRSLINIMTDNGKLLEDRIDEMLELSRLAADQVTLARQTVDLHNIVDFSTRIFKSKANEKKIKYKIEQKGTNANVICDEKRLNKILQNLIGNAIKFTPKEGSVNVEIEYKDEVLNFSVSDTGIGILKEDLEKVFDRFYQVKADNTNSNPGTGIGLAMVQEYVTLMKGKLTVQSEIDKGSKFSFSIPLETSTSLDIEDNQYEPEDHEIVFLPIQHKERPSLLIAEDNKGLRLYIRSILEPFFEIIEAENGQEALELLNSVSDIDIILSDIMMPELDGITLLSKIRSSASLRLKPVVFLTAKYNKEDIHQSYRLGVDDYLKKPFSEKELLYRLNAVYRNYRVRVDAKSENTQINDQIHDEKDDASFITILHNLVVDNLDANNFSVDLIAEKLNISSRHLIRLVNKEIGMNPKDYIREVKLNRARQILESGISDNARVVASMVGFSTPSYFLKLYKQRFGSNFK